MGLASINLTHLALKPAVLCEMTRNDGHRAVQGHSGSPILVPIESSDVTSISQYSNLFCIAPLPSYHGVLVKLSLLTAVPLSNSLIRGEPLNSDPHNVALKSQN